MLKIKKLDHVVLRANNPEKLIEFYCNVLGCSVEKKSSPEMGLTQLRAGDALIDIVAVDGQIGKRGGRAPGKEGRNMDHFCVRLEPFDEGEIREQLAKHGVEGSPLQSRYGSEGQGPSIYIQDPEGNTVELKGPAFEK